MKLPTYQEAYDAVQLGLPTPLDRFVYKNEPPRWLGMEDWRADLERALEYWRVRDDVKIESSPGTLPLPFLTDDPE